VLVVGAPDPRAVFNTCVQVGGPVNSTALTRREWADCSGFAARYRAKAVVLVERRRILVLRVDDHEPCGDEVGGGNDTPEGVGQHGTAESLALHRRASSTAGISAGLPLPMLLGSSSRTR
jgi:hypothetical protein